MNSSDQVSVHPASAAPEASLDAGASVAASAPAFDPLELPVDALPVDAPPSESSPLDALPLDVEPDPPESPDPAAAVPLDALPLEDSTLGPEPPEQPAAARAATAAGASAQKRKARFVMPVCHPTAANVLTFRRVLAGTLLLGAALAGGGCGTSTQNRETVDGAAGTGDSSTGAVDNDGPAANDPNPDAALGLDATGLPGTDGDTSVAAPARGAAVPWDEYEAEQASTNATVLAASTQLGDVQAEASGRRAVRLDNPSTYVEFVTTRAANAIVVRYSIPDAPGGGGIDSTLDLYVNGALRQALPVTSRYSWFYGVQAWQNGGPSLPSKTPGAGPFHYFDEVHALVGDIPAGSKVRLQKDAANTASYYVVDLIDLEQVGSPLTKPANVLDVAADCGATSDDGSDDAQKIQDCMNQAKTQGKGIWIPTGRFDLPGKVQGNPGITNPGVTVQGAGMWYSELHGMWAGFVCTGNGCRFSNFAVLGESTTRDDSSPDNGFAGSAGQGSSLDGIWVEHKKVGFWVGENAPSNGVTDGLVISNSRFRDLFADGVNFCNGTSHSEVVNSHFRYTGDDAVAAWSYTQPGPADTGNVFHHDTVQLPWRATCFALYGGSGEQIEDDVCSDTLTFPGIQVGGPYPPMSPFAGTTSVQRNTLLRAGGFSFNQEHGALKLFSSSIDDRGIVVSDLDIEEATYFGIDFQSDADSSTIAGSSMDSIRIDSPGQYGIQVRAGARGGITLGNVSVTSPGKGGLSDLSTGGSFAIQRGAGNTGW